MRLLKDKTTIIILTHYAFRAEKDEDDDTDQLMLRYLKNKVKRVVFITHPFPEFKFRHSYCLVYENGERVKELKVPVLKGPSWLQYLHHILLIYYFLFKTGVSFNLCIAYNNLSFISILPFRHCGFLKRLIYYSIDFVPKRFPNPFLNWVYHFIDKLACKYSDINWIMVEQQVTERVRFGITRSNSASFSIVPIGYEIKKINVQPLNKVDLYSIVYAGGFRETTGVQLILTSMPLLIKRFPKIKLTIMGAGPQADQLKKTISKLKIEKWVDFLGYIPDFKDLTDNISTKSVGLAPYAPIPESYSYYADPSKIKLYTSCGLPVITTSVATMADLISKTHSGIIIDYSEKSLSDAVTYLLSNKTRYKSYKDSAIKLSKKFDINNIFSIAFKKIPW